MKQLFLAFLDAGPAHGYQLKQRYDALFAPVWPPINIGQIYVTMGRLERDGLVDRQVVAQADRPDRKVYELTDLGRKTLDEWLSEPPQVPALDSDIVLKLMAAHVAPARGANAAQIIATHRQRCLTALRELDETIGGTADTATADLLIQGAALHLQAELRWLDLWDQHIRSQSSRKAELS